MELNERGRGKKKGMRKITSHEKKKGRKELSEGTRSTYSENKGMEKGAVKSSGTRERFSVSFCVAPRL